jgi:hypothetical protein
MPKDENLIILSNLRNQLKELMQPENLTKLADFIENTSWGDGSLLDRYKWFCENGEKGSDCRYAAMAKNFFLVEQAEKVANIINYLYHNWSKTYKK